MLRQDWEITEDDIPNWNTIPPYRQQLVDVAEIAQKKLIAWLEQPCEEHLKYTIKKFQTRRQCTVCWQRVQENMHENRD
jgi:hypothetical protein